MFTVIPAIDLSRGRLGAYSPSGPVPVGAFGGDPIEAARSFVGAGAGWLHVVDMDLAFEGAVGNADVVEAIHAAYPDVRLQVSGGIRDEAPVTRFFDAGASRVIVGSAALADEETVERLLARSGRQVFVGIEVEAGRIRSRGRDPADLDLMTSLGWLVAAGAPGFVLTTVGRVGTTEGPDVATLRRVTRAGKPTLAAGGIASLKDLISVRSAGAVGAIVGSAALSGSLPLAAALVWAQAS